MNGAQGEGKGTKPRPKKDDTSLSAQEREVQTIEYLIYQSTQGIHFLFTNEEIESVMSLPQADEAFFTSDNMTKVQSLLTKWLERPTLTEKRSFLDSLPVEEHELLIRAYFHLVETTILTHSKIRH